MLWKNNEIPICFSIAMLLAAACVVNGCEKVDLKWHKYEKRDFAVQGPQIRTGNVHVLSDGWKIIGAADDKSDTYDWGWEVTVEVDPYDKPMPDKRNPLIEIQSLDYVLCDKDGFEVSRNSLSIEKWHTVKWDDGGKGILQEYGETKTYKQTSTISKSKAARALESKYILTIK